MVWNFSRFFYGAARYVRGRVRNANGASGQNGEARLFGSNEKTTGFSVFTIFGKGGATNGVGDGEGVWPSVTTDRRAARITILIQYNFIIQVLSMSDLLSIIDDERDPSVPPNSPLGERGERLAVDHLIRNGYEIVVTNFKVPVGRNSKGVAVTGEIDIIAIDGDTLCFVEVKTRTSEDFAPAITAVDRRKQRQITRTSKVYRRLFRLEKAKVRFDVVTVILPKDGKPNITLTKGHWSDGQFRKPHWDSPSWA